jgi:hypothetical protein
MKKRTELIKSELITADRVIYCAIRRTDFLSEFIIYFETQLQFDLWGEFHN